MLSKGLLSKLPRLVSLCGYFILFFFQYSCVHLLFFVFHFSSTHILADLGSLFVDCVRYSHDSKKKVHSEVSLPLHSFGSLLFLSSFHSIDIHSL